LVRVRGTTQPNFESIPGEMVTRIKHQEGIEGDIDIED